MTMGTETRTCRKCQQEYEPPTEASFNRVWEMIGGQVIQMDGRSFRRKE